MTNEYGAMIDEWLRPDLEKVSIGNPGSKHLDELLGELPAKEDWLGISFQLFDLLIMRLLESDLPKKPVLIIPLQTDSLKIAQQTPSSKEELEQQFSNEPPSLYMVDWDQAKIKTVLEQYKAPLPFQLFESNDWYVTYREFRDQIAIENNWEITRHIFVEYFPENFR